MTVSVSDRLRDALERLDQAIDRLEAGVSTGSGAAAPPAQARRPTDSGVLALKLDRMIERIETALGD